KERFAEYLKDTDSKISELKAEAEQPELEMSIKTSLYDQVDKLQKNRDKELEEVLMEILPETFAVVKETASRFKENATLEVSAQEFDKDLAAIHQHVEIKGDKAVWHNTWTAAGSPVTWNMVHYDVQLIGGIVLHEGKIAEMA